MTYNAEQILRDFEQMRNDLSDIAEGFDRLKRENEELRRELAQAEDKLRSQEGSPYA